MLEIKSLSQFNKLKSTPLLIIDFYADWCGPCKQISPVFERLAKQHEASAAIITFAKVNVDKAKDVSQLCGITAMPTFQFFKTGKKIDEVKGADVMQLTTKIGFHTAATIKVTTEGGTRPAGASSGSSSKEAATGPGTLRSLIDIEGAKLLNNTIISNVRNIVTPPPAGSGYALASTSGARLLIHIPFTQAVTPSHLKITIAKDSASSAPSRIQIGTNAPIKVVTSKEGVQSNDLDMESSLAKAENSQSFNVFSDEYVNGTAELKLKASKFTAIKSLTIRVDANLSGEAETVSKIGEMDIIGIKA